MPFYHIIFWGGFSVYKLLCLFLAFYPITIFSMGGDVDMGIAGVSDDPFPSLDLGALIEDETILPDLAPSPALEDLDDLLSANMCEDPLSDENLSQILGNLPLFQDLPQEPFSLLPCGNSKVVAGVLQAAETPFVLPIKMAKENLKKDSLPTSVGLNFTFSDAPVGAFKLSHTAQVTARRFLSKQSRKRNKSKPKRHVTKDVKLKKIAPKADFLNIESVCIEVKGRQKQYRWDQLSSVDLKQDQNVYNLRTRKVGGSCALS